MGDSPRPRPPPPLPPRLVFTVFLPAWVNPSSPHPNPLCPSTQVLRVILSYLTPVVVPVFSSSDLPFRRGAAAAGPQ